MEALQAGHRTLRANRHAAGVGRQYPLVRRSPCRSSEGEPFSATGEGSRHAKSNGSRNGRNCGGKAVTLLELQRTMSASVMRQLTPEFGMRRKTADGKSMHAHAATFIKPGKELSSFE